MKRKIIFFLLLMIDFLAPVNVHCMDPVDNNVKQEEKDLLNAQKAFFESKTALNKHNVKLEDIKISDTHACKTAAIKTTSEIVVKKSDDVLNYVWSWATGEKAELDAEIKDKRKNEKELAELNKAKAESEKKLNDLRLITEEQNSLISMSNSGRSPYKTDECKKRIETLQARKDAILEIPAQEKPIVNDNTPKETTTEKKEPTPGMIRQAAALVAATTVGAADGIANIFAINKIGNSPYFKSGFLDTHRVGFGRATAAVITAGTLGALYKAYQWYYNEDRLLAEETVIELEEKQKEIALQFNKEIEKSTLSAEEKAKLNKAYEHYMDELQEEIDEQKIIAGHGVTKKVAIGLAIAAGGIAGLTTLAHYYLGKPIDMPRGETKLEQDKLLTTADKQTSKANTPVIATNTKETIIEKKNPTDSEKAKDNHQSKSDASVITTPEKINSQQPDAYNSEEYNKITVKERLFSSWNTPERQQEIDRLDASKKQYNLAIQQQEREALAKIWENEKKAAGRSSVTPKETNQEPVTTIQSESLAKKALVVGAGFVGSAAVVGIGYLAYMISGH